MKRGVRIGAITLLVAVLAVVVVSVALRRGAGRRPNRQESSETAPRQAADDAALAQLTGIPLYRWLLRAESIRSARLDGQGILHVEVDLRAVVEPRLASMGFRGASSLFPKSAKGAIAIEQSAGGTASVALRESWSFEGPAAGLDILDRNPVGPVAPAVVQSIPGAPSAVARFRLLPSGLADPSFGGPALASWRDRASFAEKLLGRPLRAEIAEDLAGPVIFALYEGTNDTTAEALFAAELRRSDRLAGLLDTLFGLGALTERATVSRYRGVSTGSFLSSSGRGSLALAVDGPVLLVATSRARLESAIDARRAVPQPRAGENAGGREPSWSAVSDSAFVRRGWARLVHSKDPPGEAPVATTEARLWPEGASGWRLDGTGPAPAVTADPMLPFVRSVFGRAQRGAD